MKTIWSNATTMQLESHDVCNNQIRWSKSSNGLNTMLQEESKGSYSILFSFASGFPHLERGLLGIGVIRIRMLRRVNPGHPCGVDVPPNHCVRQQGEATNGWRQCLRASQCLSPPITHLIMVGASYGQPQRISQRTKKIKSLKKQKKLRSNDKQHICTSLSPSPSM